MAVFQEKQEKAQAELDRVVGRERLPDYEDEKNLPFVSAFVKEVLRWRSVAILAGIPHAPTADDVYRGYFSRSNMLVPFAVSSFRYSSERD